MAKTSSKRTTSKATSSKPAPSLQAIFRRWLVAGLLGVAFYLTAALVTALYIKSNSDGAVDPSGSFVISALVFLALACGLWWLIESALGIILYITRNSKPASKKKK